LPQLGKLESKKQSEKREGEEEGEEREGEEEKEEGAGDEESSGSDADSESHHIEEEPEAPPLARDDIPPTPVPSPFTGDQRAGDETATQLEEGETQGEKDVLGSSSAVEPPKKKLKIIHSGAAAPTSPS